MKKIIGLIALTMLFTMCDVSVKQVSAESTAIPIANVISVKTLKIDGIEYKLFYSTTYSNSRAPFVVNHTKELLETELIKLQLGELKKCWVN